MHRPRTGRHWHGMGEDPSQRCQITLCWCILPPECQGHRRSSTHDGLRATSEQPNSLTYMANGWLQPARYRLVPGHRQHKKQHQNQRKPWGIPRHARCCSSHPDCQGTSQRWQHPWPLLNKQRDPHHKMYSYSRDIRPRRCTNREQTKTTKESSTNTTHPHMETRRLERHKDPHRNSLVQPTRRGQGWGDSRAPLGLAYIHSGRSNQSFHPTQTDQEKRRASVDIKTPEASDEEGEEAVLQETTQAYEMQHQQTQEGSTTSTEALPARVLEIHQWHLTPSRKSGPREQKEDSVELCKELQEGLHWCSFTTEL